jgi:CheY-like chemotaxis protein
VQVLSNLLHNAVKFTDPGGSIAINGDIVDSSDDRRDLRLSVADTGAGIAPEMLPRIFELFTQGERHSPRAHGGLGIGLALARRIVEMHGGRIDARSDGHHRGSEFTIWMPLVERTFEPQPTPGALERPVLNRRVLIIDDNDDAAEMLAAIVRAMGGTAKTANNARDGIERVSDFAPDIILLDIGMSEMDGYEACRRIRQQPAGRTVTIVAVTGWGQERDKQRATEAGFDAHVTKPVDPAALERLLFAVP